MIAPLALSLAMAAAGPRGYEFTADPATLKTDAMKNLVAELSDPRKGSAAARRLVQFGRSATDALVRALADKRLQVRYYAASVLEVVGDPVGTAALYRRLLDRKEHSIVRKIAARAMGSAGYRPAAGVLVRLAREGPDEVEEPRSDGPSTPAAERNGVVVDEEDFRFEVIRALVYVGTAKGDEVLVASLADDSARIREVAATGLGDRQLIAALGPLRKALKDPEGRVAAAAAKALGRFARRAAPAVGDLVEALDREDVRVRRACLRALALATDRSFKTPGRWRKWWSKKLDPEGAARSGSSASSAGDTKPDEHVPLPVVDARVIFKDPPPSSRREGDSSGPTPPALRMPWETDESEKPH